MSDRKTSETIEFLVGFWLGILAFCLSWIKVVPAVVFVPDGVLSIAAGFAVGSGHPKVAEVIVYLALVLFVVGLILLLEQAPT